MKTTVIFRKFKDTGDIIALFPYEIATPNGETSSYMHIGQHGSASWDCLVDTTVLATLKEYTPLLRELQGIGYDLDIKQKRNHSRYIETYYGELMDKSGGAE